MPVIDPRLMEHLTLALRAQVRGDWLAAEQGYLEVLSIDGHQQDAWANLGAVLRSQGRSEEALVVAQRATEEAPSNPVAWINLGLCLLEASRLQEARTTLIQALSLAPGEPSAHSAMARLQQALGDDRSALACHQQALAHAPSSSELAINVGYGHLRLGELAQAEAILAHERGRDPVHPRALWLTAYLRMLQGRWHEAWPHFHARLLLPEARENLRDLSAPRWDGTTFHGQTLLVWGEQGYGDALMALRLLPRVRARGGRVIVQTYGTLIPLLRDSLAVDAWVPEGQSLPDHDLQIPMLDLPALLDLDPADTGPTPYLRVPPSHQPPEPLERKLPQHSGQRRIGIVWSGNPRHIEDKRRSLPPDQLAPLASVPGIQWFGLQLSDSAQPPLPGLQQLGPDLRDFADTSWALKRLDALVTVDTAIAHLGGALGIPTHLLIPRFPDWRWGLGGTRTPWYPSVRLYRQGEDGSWATPLGHVREALR